MKLKSKPRLTSRAGCLGKILIVCASLSFLFHGTLGLAQANNAKGANASGNKAVNTGAQGQAKRIKYKKDTKVDFDDELIEGGVKNPFQSMIGGRDGNIKQGFIKIRREWHDQMIMSLNGLKQ